MVMLNIPMAVFWARNKNYLEKVTAQTGGHYTGLPLVYHKIAPEKY